jgi:hypothetical protein
MAFEIRSSFIGNYKLGDNISYNVKLLALLYGYFNNSTANTTLTYVGHYRTIVETLRARKLVERLSAWQSATCLREFRS